MKKIIFTVLAMGVFQPAFTQFKVVVEATGNYKAKDAILYTLDGSKDIIKAKEAIKGNTWLFTVPNRYVGMMKLYFPQTNSSVTFISENRDVRLAVSGSESKVKEVEYLDASNILMEKVQDNQKKNEMIFPALVQIKEYYKNSSEFGIALQKEIDRLGEKIEISPEKNPFVSFYHTNYNRFLVESAGKTVPTDSEVIDFLVNSSEVLESSSLMRPVIAAYLNTSTNQNLQIKVDRLLEKADTHTPRGQTILSELIDLFDMYDMADIKEKYLTQASNLKCTINNRLSSTIKVNQSTAIGATFPNYNFKAPKNTTAKSIADVKADKKVIVFWSSTCSHCEKEIPQLLEKYSVLKANNIEIIGLSMDDNAEAYTSKISIFPWINDSELKGWNASYAETYNIHATPYYYILDQNNKIIAKPDHVTDVLRFLNVK